MKDLKEYIKEALEVTRIPSGAKEARNQAIMKWLEENAKTTGKIRIRQDGTVDVPRVTIEGDLEKIEVKFHKCTTFDVVDCPNLKSLEGCPDIVEDLTVYNCNSLKNLEGCPIYISREFSVKNCSNLESIKGAPEEVNGRMILANLPNLKTLEGCTKKVDTFSIANIENLKSLEGGPEEVRYYNVSRCGIVDLGGSPKKGPKIGYMPGYVFSADFDNLPNLKSIEGCPKVSYNLKFYNCPKLETLDGIEKMVLKQTIVHFHYCKKLDQNKQYGDLKIHYQS